jgi:alpha-L-fucosidase
MWPKDPAVLENLQKWQGYKFGLLIHMGLYSELGTVESWGLCPEDWVSRPGYDDYCQYASDYRNAKSRFNPVDFDPARWARGFRSSGARYVIYSTKHHDGFCLYDTRYTDFKVTDPGCPFSSNPRANVYREVLNACRAEGLVVGAYFSKPDWTTPFFWWPYYPPKDRNPSYDITKHPDRWRNFVEFTQNQIHEITTEYGPIDILWLDGCWVLPKSAITPKVAEFCQYPHDMDINMKKIAEQARAANPGMLVVDRWVEGEFENYLTPEQRTPDKALAVPWESCITMGHAWGWVPNDRYKSARELVQLLIGVVAKGGNLLLGVGPDGTGKFEPAVFQRFEELGRWLAVNGEAIYDTHPVEPFQEGRMAYTAGANNTIHALYMLADGESELPEYLDVSTTLKGRIRVTQLSSGKTLSHRPIPGGIRISIPKNLGKMLATEEAVVFRLKSE